MWPADMREALSSVEFLVLITCPFPTMPQNSSFPTPRGEPLLQRTEVPLGERSVKDGDTIVTNRTLMEILCFQSPSCTLSSCSLLLSSLLIQGKVDQQEVHVFRKISSCPPGLLTALRNRFLPISFLLHECKEQKLCPEKCSQSEVSFQEFQVFGWLARHGSSGADDERKYTPPVQCEGPNASSRVQLDLTHHSHGSCLLRWHGRVSRDPRNDNNLRCCLIPYSLMFPSDSNSCLYAGFGYLVMLSFLVTLSLIAVFSSSFAEQKREAHQWELSLLVE